MFNRLIRCCLLVWLGLAIDLALADSVVLTDVTKPIMVQPNSNVVELKLRSNPTTGYSWFLKKYNHHLFEDIGYAQPLYIKEFFSPR